MTRDATNRPRRPRFALALGICMTVLAVGPGCANREDSRDDRDATVEPVQAIGESPDASPAAESNPEAAESASSPALSESVTEQPVVTLELAGAAELEAAIAERRGRVVLVDFWATWCVPCLELLPHTVELRERFADEGLAVISVSLDNPDARGRVLAFLEQHGATFPNFISREGAGTKSMEQFDLPGPLPQMKIYDRQGNLARTLPEPGTSLDADQIDLVVEKVLGN